MKRFIKKAICLLLVGLTLTAAGCVQTPEDDAITGKTKIDGDHVGELMSEGDPTMPQKQELGQPEHLKESYKTVLGVQGDERRQALEYTVEIDADVRVPESGVYPVYAVEKPRLMDEGLFERLISVLFSDCDYITVAPNGSEYAPGCFTTESRYMTGTGTDADTGESFSKTLELVQGKGIVDDMEHDYEEFLVYCNNDGEDFTYRYHSSDIQQIGLPDYIFSYYEEQGGYEVEDYAKIEGEFMRNETDYETALGIVNGFLSETGLSDVMGLAYSGRTRFTTRRRQSADFYEAWGFALVPRVGDARMAPVDVDNTVDVARLTYRSTEHSMEFDRLYMPNTLRIYVYNGEIALIKWSSCVADEVSETISQNAPLLQFSDIYSVFKDKLAVQGYYPPLSAKEAQPQSARILIDRIELCYYRVKTGGGTGEYAIVPVWVFCGKTEWRFRDPSETDLLLSKDGTCLMGDAGYTFMIINAMDGSIIDPARGY